MSTPYRTPSAAPSTAPRRVWTVAPLADTDGLMTRAGFAWVVLMGTWLICAAEFVAAGLCPTVQRWLIVNAIATVLWCLA